jgi:hypothetical protein
MSNARDVWVPDLRGRSRFAQKTRSRARILRDLSVDDFKSYDGIQYGVACAISYCHGSGAELGRESVGAHFNFEVIVL